YVAAGLDYYMLFYGLQDKINSVSLLLFWSDLWVILVSIYVYWEKFLNGEEQEEQEEPEFDIQNFLPDSFRW
ncbi:23696_t:CDS:1, partial [Racocetra persica]